MTVGIGTTTLANKWLDMISGTAFTAPATVAVKLHTADPGAAGATAPSANVTRVTLALGAAASGSKAAVATFPQWASWASGAETITHISVWDALTVGNFLFSVVLTTAKAVTNGDTLNLTALSISFAPLAA